MTTELKNILGSLELKVEEKKAEWDVSPVKSNHSYYDLATQELVSFLFSSYPFDWAFYVAGSWGRQDLHSHSDQDHFIFISQPFSADELTAYQSGLRMIESFLDHCGLPLCSGGIMSSRPDWQFIGTNFSIEECFPSRFVTVEKADILYRGRFLAGTKDLRPNEISEYFEGQKYRKLILSYLIFNVFCLATAFTRKNQSEHLKRIAHVEFALTSQLVVPESEGYFSSLRSGFISLKKILHQYQDLFPR